MYPTLFILTVVLILAVALVIDGLILTGIMKLFKVKNISLKKNIHTLVFSGLITALVAFVLGRLFPESGLPINLALWLVAYLSFYYYLKKFYQTKWSTALGIFILDTIVVWLLLAMVGTSSIFFLLLGLGSSF